MKLSELKTIVDLLCEEGCGEIEASFDGDGDFDWLTEDRRAYICNEKLVYFLRDPNGDDDCDLYKDGSIHDPEFRKEFVSFLKENFK